MKRNGKPRQQMLALPGFIWQLAPEAPKSKPLARALAAIQAAEDEGKAVMREGGYTGEAMGLALEAAPAHTCMKTDEETVWVEYNGVRWFMSDAANLRSGVPAELYEAVEPVDVLAAIDTILSPDRPAFDAESYVKVSISLRLHGLPEAALTRVQAAGYVMRFTDVERIGEALYQAKHAQRPALCAALEMEIAGRIPTVEDALTLWYPAKNDDTAEGYGVTVSTEPRQAAAARQRAALRLEAMRRSQGGERVTVAELVGGPLYRSNLDPCFVLIADAPALPAPGYKHVAHFENGNGGGLRPITGGTPDRARVLELARQMSKTESRPVRVYCFGPEDAAPGYVYAADGSGRVIVTGYPVTLAATFEAGALIPGYGEQMLTDSGGVLPEAPRPPVEDTATHYNPSGVPVSEAAAEAVTKALASAAPLAPPYVAPVKLAPAAPPPPAPGLLTVTVRPLDLAPIADLYHAAAALLEGSGTTAHLRAALDQFEEFASLGESK